MNTKTIQKNINYIKLIEAKLCKVQESSEKYKRLVKDLVQILEKIIENKNEINKFSKFQLQSTQFQLLDVYNKYQGNFTFKLSKKILKFNLEIIEKIPNQDDIQQTTQLIYLYLGQLYSRYETNPKETIRYLKKSEQFTSFIDLYQCYSNDCKKLWKKQNQNQRKKLENLKNLKQTQQESLKNQQFQPQQQEQPPQNYFFNPYMESLPQNALKQGKSDQENESKESEKPFSHYLENIIQDFDTPCPDDDKTPSQFQAPLPKNTQQQKDIKVEQPQENQEQQQQQQQKQYVISISSSESSELQLISSLQNSNNVSLFKQDLQQNSQFQELLMNEESQYKPKDLLEQSYNINSICNMQNMVNNNPEMSQTNLLNSLNSNEFLLSSDQIQQNSTTDLLKSTAHTNINNNNNNNNNNNSNNNDNNEFFNSSQEEKKNQKFDSTGSNMIINSEESVQKQLILEDRTDYLQYCDKHPKFQMNIVCMKENCEKKGHIGCCKCLLKEHHDHNLETDIVDIEQVVQKLYNIKQESTSIKQKEQVWIKQKRKQLEKLKQLIIQTEINLQEIEQENEQGNLLLNDPELKHINDIDIIPFTEKTQMRQYVLNSTKVLQVGENQQLNLKEQYQSSLNNQNQSDKTHIQQFQNIIEPLNQEYSQFIQI